MDNKNKAESPNWDALTGLFGVGFGLVYGMLAYSMPRAAFGNPLDPLYFPLGVAAISILIGAVLLLKSNFRASVSALKNLLNEDSIKKMDRRRIMYTCVISTAYALLFDHLGYVISTFLFLLAMLTITRGKEKMFNSAIIAFVFAAGVYLVFSTLLSISLPPLPFME